MPVVEHTEPDPDRDFPVPVNIRDDTRERLLERARKWSFTKKGDVLGVTGMPVNMYSLFYNELKHRKLPEEIEI